MASSVGPPAWGGSHLPAQRWHQGTALGRRGASFPDIALGLVACSVVLEKPVRDRGEHLVCRPFPQ
jgi:hypothetical protein